MIFQGNPLVPEGVRYWEGRIPLDLVPDGCSLEWYFGPCKVGPGAWLGDGAEAGVACGVCDGFEAVGGTLGGTAACFGYCRRAAAPAADLAGLDVAEPIGFCVGLWVKMGTGDVLKLW